MSQDRQLRSGHSSRFHMPPPNLIFDLDGTLVDSLPDLRSALNQMLRGFGARELRPAEVRLMIGDGTPSLVDRALAATGAAAEFDLAHRMFLRFYEGAPTRLSRLYPGVRETLIA